MKVLQNEDDNIIVNEYPADPLRPHSRVGVAGGYLTIFGTFDIETTIINRGTDPKAIMYIWQACIGDMDGRQRDVYVGRTWADFLLFIEQIADKYKLNKKRRMVWFIHNAGFEFQFLRSILSISDMFAVKPRVPISFIGNLWHEFRCSWKLSNMSLSAFCENEKVAHGKLSGFDYLKERFPDTVLADFELLYYVDDVLGLHEAICHLMKTGGDTLASLPKTSTGFVRREARERVQANPKNAFIFRDTQLSDYEYKLCKAATRGGNTHANVLYAGDLLGEDRDGAPEVIGSRDKKSSYPFEMVTGDYPVGKFAHDRAECRVERLTELCEQGDAVIMHVVLYNVRLKPQVFFPYIAKNKCQSMSPKANAQYWYDNGRVLKAPVLRMSICDIDAQIIDAQYDYDYVDVIDSIRTVKGQLCKEYRDYVLELFRVKCELEFGDEYYYNKYKNRINALFGMMLTDISREEVTYEMNKWGSELPPVAQELAKYYTSHNSFLEYQHGIYVTANARKSLQAGLDLVGIDGVYTDTDSVKHLGNYDEQFNALNQSIIDFGKSRGVEPVTVNGKTSILGIWEKDASYSAFITHGAKKYAYRYTHDECNKPKKRGHIGVTVAGLNKNKAAEYLNNHGGLVAFNAGNIDDSRQAIFDEQNSGRLEAKYDDDVRYEQTTYIGADGKAHAIELTSNVALVPTTYTLGITEEYARLIEMRETVFM